MAGRTVCGLARVLAARITDLLNMVVVSNPGGWEPSLLYASPPELPAPHPWIFGVAASEIWGTAEKGRAWRVRLDAMGRMGGAGAVAGAWGQLQGW